MTALAASARFCSGCGTPVSIGSVSAEERKVVTVLFCDLTRSSELSGLLDAELLRTILLQYYAVMQQCIESHGGIVEKFIGDAVMAVFGLTITREDDARRALTAASDMMDGLAQLNVDLQRDHNVQLKIRVGLHTGEVVTTAEPLSRQALVSGEVVNIAARLEQEAAPGEVMLSGATQRAAGSGLAATTVGRLALKGISDPVEAVRLISVLPPDPDAMRRFDVPFVGRDRDLGAIDLIWGRVVEQGDAHLLTVLGEAGIGKTRLLAEWRRRHSDTIWAVGTGRCQSFGASGSLAALADCLALLVSELEGRSEDDEVEVAAAIALLQKGLLLDGMPSPSSDETNSAVTHVLAALAAERPVLLVIDDFHSAEHTLTVAIDRIMDDLDRLPIMLVCLARPELIDMFPGWGSGRANATTVTITGLSRTESATLAASLANDEVPHEQGIIERIVAQADGNPLYLEHLSSAVHERSGMDQLPPNLQALIAARIDQLEDIERMALRYAGIVGRIFGSDDLRQLADDAFPFVDYETALRSLARRRFIAPIRTPFGAEPMFSFANVITQRVVYEGLTKRWRAELHERFAAYLASLNRPDALIGQHLEQAYRCYAAIGGLDERKALLRKRAATHIARAGGFALRRVDFPRARVLLTRAIELSDPGDASRPEWFQKLGAALLTLGHTDEARQALRKAVNEAKNIDLPVIAAHAHLLLEGSWHDDARIYAAAKRVLPVFASADDALGLARSELILARDRQRAGRHTDALAILEQAISHSASALADQEFANSLGALGMSLWNGPVPARQAIDRCELLLAEYGAERSAVRATLGFPLTALYAAQGCTAQAEESLAVTQSAMASISYAESRVFRPLLTALVAISGDQEREARAALLDALDAARALQAPELIARASLELARLHAAQSRWDDAHELVNDLAIHPGHCADLAGQLGLRSRICAINGEGDNARRLARNALAAAKSTDSPIVQAIAFLDQAHTYAALGRFWSARTAARAARRLFTAKGDLSGAARAERFVAKCAVIEEKVGL